MTFAQDIAFYAGTALYLAAAAVSLRYLATGTGPLLRVAERLLLFGAACLIAVLALRWSIWGRLPLTTMSDALNLFAVLSTVLVVAMAKKEDTAALLSFVAPPLALICLVNAATGYIRLHAEPRHLRSLPLALHVGTAFLAYAYFFVASTVSAAYLWQATRLKRHRTRGLVRRLPSLEHLDATLYRLVAHGYPLFGATLVLGALWAAAENTLLTPQWWLAPKVLVATAMLVFYGITFHLRRAGQLRGPKLARLVFTGFCVLLAAYLGLTFLHLRTYHFWGAGA